MIVSKFTNGPQGALQGFDFLARSGRQLERDSSVSSFSELLGGSNAAPLVAPASKDLRLQVRGGTERPSETGMTDPRGVSEPSQLAASQGAPASLPEQSVVRSALDEAPPIFRDPRLDDPAELALEAAAIALAASLLAKPQDLVPVPAPIPAEDLACNCGPEQGGEQSEDTVSPQDVQAGVSASLTLQPGEPARLVRLQGTESDVPAGRWTSVSVAGLEQDGDTQSPPSSVAPELGVAPKFLAPVVVNANQRQAAALAEAGSELVSGAKTVPLSVSYRSSVAQTASGLVDSSLTAGQVIQAGGEAGDAKQISVPSPERTAHKASDAGFLASPIPANPAAAFFAAHVQRPKAQSASQLVGTEPKEEMADQSTVLGLLADADAAPPVSLGFEGHGQKAYSASGRSDTASSVVSVALQQSPDALSLEEAELGTFGAEGESVSSEASPRLERTEESSAPVAARGQELSSLSAPQADSSSIPTSLTSTTGESSRTEHSNLSRPTVLPPVHARSSELFNVVQNALERARSENPSHLAVEVTLDDGSSFGLEVRMSASGLQASFRSESQPLLKALENSWSGFLAKETAESKVVSAAFEGRSGSGEFSNNGSGAGERRQQFEDTAAASFLGGSSTKASSREVSAGEGPAKVSVPEGGTAVYA